MFGLKSLFEKKQTIKLQCDKCGFYFTPDNIYKKCVEHEEETHITYFKCPKCGAIYTLTIKDVHYEELHNTYLASVGDYKNMKCLVEQNATDENRRELTRRLVVSQSNLQRLKSYRNELKEKYNIDTLQEHEDKLFRIV